MSDDEGQWYVIIEATTGFGRENQLWAVAAVEHCPDRAGARQLAMEFTETYRPEHPASPKGRHIFEIGTDLWLVQMQGAMRDYHFRVSVARHVGSRKK